MAVHIKTVNLKGDRPTVREALDRFAQEITKARQEGILILKIIHGYGSGGSGGDIRIAVQKRLRELKECGNISTYFFGEDWSKSDDTTWQLLQAHPELKSDRDLGRGNPGIASSSCNLPSPSGNHPIDGSVNGLPNG